LVEASPTCSEFVTSNSLCVIFNWQLSALYFHVAITCYCPTYWYVAKTMSPCTLSWLVMGEKQMEKRCF